MSIKSAVFELYHPLGMKCRIEFTDDPFMEVGGLIKKGWLTAPPTAAQTDAFKETANSVQITEISQVVISRWIREDGKEALAAFFYAPWGDKKYGSQMTVYLNNPEDITAFEKACGKKLEDFPEYDDNQGPKKSHRDFASHAVDVAFSVTRHKEVQKDYTTGEPVIDDDGKPKIRWVLDSYGASNPKADVAPSTEELDWQELFKEASAAGINGQDLLAHLGVKRAGAFTGTAEDVRAAIEDMTALKKTPPAQAANGSKKAPSAKNWWESEESTQKLDESTRELFGQALEEVGNWLEKEPSEFASLKDFWTYILQQSVKTEQVYFCQKVKYVANGKAKYFVFPAAFNIRYYGHHKDLAALLNNDDINRLIVGAEMELEAPVGIRWEKKGKGDAAYLQAVEFIGAAESEEEDDLFDLEPN